MVKKKLKYNQANLTEIHQKLTPQERLDLGFELAEWALELNKKNGDFQKSLEGYYLLIK